MPRTAQSWKQKLANAKAKSGQPSRQHCPKTGEWFVIPGVCELEEIVRGIPEGKLLPVPTITDALRQRHEVDFACPLTTGIFLWILANASAEQEQVGEPADLPWWRVVKKGGELSPKYPGGGQLQQCKLEAEGHVIAVKGKKRVVEGCAQALADV